MKLPPAGLCLPCTVAHVRDGDTVVVRIRKGGLLWPIRLLDCWCAEAETPEGKAATAYMRKLLRQAKQLHVWIPQPAEHIENLLKLASFDRLFGYIFVSESETVNELMVAEGLATAKKGKPKCVA